MSTNLLVRSSHAWSAYFSSRGEGWHLSFLRLLWAPLHVTFAATILRLTLLQQSLPALPYPGLRLFTELPVSFVLLLASIHIFCAVLLFLGWHTRGQQVLLALLSVPLFFHSASTYQNHDAFYLAVTLTMMGLPSERFFSLDARRMQRHSSASDFTLWQHAPVSLFAQRLILLHLSALYFFAGLAKLSPEWMVRWSATPEMTDLMRGGILVPLWSLLQKMHIAWLPLLIAGLSLLALSIGIHFARYSPWIIACAAVLHLLFELHFPVMQFTPMVLAILLSLGPFPASSPPLQTIAAAFEKNPPLNPHKE